MDDETSNCMGMDLHAYMEARRRRELAAQAEQKAGENYPAWVKACFARATPAPNTEEITIEAPESWTWVPTSTLQALKDRISELEADARIKAANASAQMEDAHQEAAQCWCDDETRGIVMDVRLAHAVARRIAGWRSCAAHHANASDLYRGLLDKCAEHLGPAAYTADDGSVMLDPVRLKIPELVAAAVKGAPAGEPVEFKGLNGETIVGRMVK